MNVTRLIMHGANGRMGTEIVALARVDSRFEVVAALGRGDTCNVSSADVVIDFSTTDSTASALEIAEQTNAALLVGTTGLSDGTLATMEVSAQSRPVLIAPNTSMGVALLVRMAKLAARTLPDRFDVEIVEVHHRAKVDAPSGTANALRSAIEDTTGRRIGDEHVHALRAGDVVGEHTILFAGDEQIVKISHSATSRRVFARGALDAAAWLRGRSPGRYTIDDVLDSPVA